MESTSGTFLVTHTDADSAILQDIHSRQVYSLAEQPDLTEGTVIQATIAPQPPLEVTWQVEHLDRRFEIPIDIMSDHPSDQAIALADQTDRGEIAKTSLADGGELHVLVVGTDEIDDAITDIQADQETIARAARIGADRVELRSGDGFVSVRYLS